MNKKTNKLNNEDNEPTFEQLMQKFQFHNNAVQHHAHIAQFIGDHIRQDFTEKAKESGYFTDEFFEEKNKAKAEPGETSPGGVSQTSEARQDVK